MATFSPYHYCMNDMCPNGKGVHLVANGCGFKPQSGFCAVDFVFIHIVIFVVSNSEAITFTKHYV